MRNTFLILSLLAFGVACDRPENRPKVESRDDTQVVTKKEKSALIPYDVSGIESDRSIEQKIRQQIDQNSALSPYAKNINVTVINGVLTLRGLTSNTQEKEWLESVANQIQSAEKVHIQLQPIH